MVKTLTTRVASLRRSKGKLTSGAKAGNQKRISIQSSLVVAVGASAARAHAHVRNIITASERRVAMSHIKKKKCSDGGIKCSTSSQNLILPTFKKCSSPSSSFKSPEAASLVQFSPLPIPSPGSSLQVSSLLRSLLPFRSDGFCFLHKVAIAESI